MTTGDNPQPFLLYHNGPDAEERVVIFAKEHHIQKLADSDVWCMVSEVPLVYVGHELFLKHACRYRNLVYMLWRHLEAGHLHA
jgi:hypothetical protein